MLRYTGIDGGATGTREVTVPLFGGGASLGGGGRQAAAVSSADLTFRRIGLPAANRDVRRQVIQEELTYSLPFSLHEAAWDWVEESNEAWVVVAPREKVELTQRRAPGARLDAEPLCYLRAAQAAEIRSALVIDFGASRTTFCALTGQRIDWVRVMLRGGDALTQRLAASKGDADAAEQLKRSQGTDLRECGLFLRDLLDEAFLPEPFPYDFVLVCGGGSALPGLLDFLRGYFPSHVDVRPFPMPTSLSHERHVVAYGAALGGRPGALSVTLRRREVERKATANWAWMLWVPVLAALVAANLETRHNTLSARRDAARQVLVEAATPIVGDAANLPPQEIVKKVETHIQDRKKVLAASPGALVDALGRSSAAFRANEGSDLRNVEYDDEKIKLEGKVVGLAQTEAIKSALSEIFVGVEQVKTRPGADDTFVFTIEGKLPEP